MKILNFCRHKGYSAEQLVFAAKIAGIIGGKPVKTYGGWWSIQFSAVLPPWQPSHSVEDAIALAMKLPDFDMNAAMQHARTTYHSKIQQKQYLCFAILDAACALMPVGDGESDNVDVSKVEKPEAHCAELLSLFEQALEWIDAVPKDTVLPPMPGFDRDHADSVIDEIKRGDR